MKATQVFINRWMEKEDTVQIYSGISLSHNNEWFNAICSNRDEPRYHQTEWSQSEKDKYVISLICDILKKWYRWTYLWNRDRLTEETNLWLSKMKGRIRIMRSLGLADTCYYIQNKQQGPVTIAQGTIFNIL